MRDLLLKETLRRLAQEAAVCLNALVAEGRPVPFDVAEQPGPDSLFHSYTPLTSRFVEDHEQALRGLASFVPARNAVDASGVAAAYLEARGEPVPTDPAARADRLLIVFLASLWEGCAEFSLDRERLDRAVEALDAEARGADEAEVLIAPLVGLKMTLPSLDLPHGVRLVRADMVESPPPDAVRSEGMGRASWEPQFFAVAEQGEGSESASEALRQLRELISVMRLFKAGGIGLGPYAFAPTGEGHWARIPTGAPATRPGGYRLDEEDSQRLAALAADLEARPDPDSALSWAVARFEMGCARESALEGLSDHLLALRAVLESQGPIGASLTMRASALICGGEDGDRIAARGEVESALELERALMSGSRPQGGMRVAVWIEDGVRRLLREAALGALGTDLGAAAEESLIATGLAEGDAEITVSVADPPNAPQGSPGTPGRAASPSDQASSVGSSRGSEGEALIPEEPAINLHSSPQYDLPPEESELMDDDATRIMEPIPAADEIQITATNWLDEVSADDGTMEWAAAESDIDHRERVDSPRVRHLFPVPEDADWEVRELKYDHYRRAG